MKYQFLIGAAMSGSGKTTLTMGLLRALRNRGLRVQPYKCGPDYIDPMFHEQAAGRKSINLDTYMSSEGHVRNIFLSYGKDADVCVAEGVMGLFDGYDRDAGSSAEVADVCALPVVLVVNARSVAYSVAATILGFKLFLEERLSAEQHRGGRVESAVDDQHPADRNTYLAGVVFNCVASENHYLFLRKACEDVGVRCLGYIPRNPRLSMPNRHLGLTISAREEMEQFISLAAEEVEKHIDMDALLDVCAKRDCGNSQDVGQLVFSTFGQVWPARRGKAERPTLAVARDEAFNFIYQANIDALAMFADICYFSPLNDKTLPVCDMLYLPGGYPELFAEQLEANTSIRQQIKAFAEAGGHIIAECGGFMYLCKDIDGREMCDVFHMKTTMHEARLHLGYRQIPTDAIRASGLAHNGSTLRGHEFHYSSLIDRMDTKDADADMTVICAQSSASGRPVSTPICRYKNVIGGYTHWYWAENGPAPLFAPFDTEKTP
ncbi:MAG: cobyrinate a,c-diamide synthase [Bacteroidaceae bacterium]|nr:cobyrinate a,c-diamide synthase [Bacteroidaceae bacterium]